MPEVQPTREQVDELARDAGESELARRFVETLSRLSARLAKPDLDSQATRELIRALVARLGDDLRMLRESWSGRMPSPPPPEGRPLQSRPDAPLSLLCRQLEAIAEGARVLIAETPRQGSASIVDAGLGPLTQAQHLAAMTLRVQEVDGRLPA
ncbi:MAG TPA: hypothetical protein VFZ12_00185 [Dehalococcoidia bacterium]|nr:hypothetical protein [Dehalococcoidia bacterium]